jgi:hypothetical protein
MAGAAVEAIAGRFSPPSGTLVLTRTLYRSLPDGKEIVIARRYTIRFSPEDDGYRLDGELLGADVVAPPVLANLAEIERNRPDRGLFPARLDSDGMIRGSDMGPVDSGARQQAVGGATSLIARAPLPTGTKQESNQFLAQVAKASSGTAWPRFLFNPGQNERRESREIALPDGTVGHVEVRVHAEGVMPSGLARMVERTVTTRLSGTERVTREVWTLAP